LHISSHLDICLHHFVIQVCGFFVLASFALFLHSAQFVQSLHVFLQFFSHIVVCVHHFVIQVSGIFVFANFALFWHPADFTKSYCALQIFPHPVNVCTTLWSRFMAFLYLQILHSFGLLQCLQSLTFFPFKKIKKYSNSFFSSRSTSAPLYNPDLWLFVFANFLSLLAFCCVYELLLFLFSAIFFSSS
jgi:hypothetical protein